MNIDLKNPEERANLFTDLGKFQVQCLASSAKGDRSFNTLLKIWDITSEVLWAQGYWQDYLRCGEIALNCATQLHKRDVEGRILNELGWAQMEQENFLMAHRRFSQSLQVFEAIGDRVSQGQSLRYMGVLHFRRRYFGLALKCYRQALKTAQEGLEQDPLHQRLLHQQAEIRNLLGNLYFKLWNLAACRRELVASLRGFRTLQRLYVSPTPSPYLYFQPVPLLNLGRAALLAGRYSKAENYFDRCYRLCERIDRRDTLAGVLFRRAELARVQGKKEEAEKWARQAEAIAGQEAPPLRNRAMSFRSRLRGDFRQHIQAIRYRVRMVGTLTIDLLVHAPLVLLRSIGYYVLFMGSKFTVKILGRSRLKWPDR